MRSVGIVMVNHVLSTIKHESVRSCGMPLHLANVAILHKHRVTFNVVLTADPWPDIPDPDRALEPLVAGCHITTGAVEAGLGNAWLRSA